VGRTLFEQVRQKRGSQQVADQIRELIINGTLKPSTQLPSEREMAVQFGVSRATLREALQSLASLGYLEVRHGIGTTVSQHAAIGDPGLWVPWLASHRDDVVTLLDVREALEVKAAALAAEAVAARRPETAEMMKAVAANLASWGKTSVRDDIVDIERLDMEFHLLITEMSGNSLLLRLDTSINHLISDRKGVMSVPGRSRQSLAEHRQIRRAIRGGDPGAAASAMAAHMASLKATVRELA
jgi:GntR family transcriptional repressor for pyruvate dehydrogenase complex